MKIAGLILACLLLSASCTKDKVIEPVAGDCQDTISFQAKVLSVITNNCVSCHSNFATYDQIKSNADLMLSRMRASGSALMPQGGPALNDSIIKHFDCWIKQGKLDN